MNKKYLYMLSTGHLSVDINSGSLPAILPFFVSEYGMDYTSIAGLMFASSFLSSVIQPLFGWLADKGSRQWFMGLGVLMTGLSLALTGFVQDYWSIFAAVTIMGIGSSIFHPEGARNVNAIAGAQKGQGMSIFSAGGNSGFGIGPLLAVFLITTFGMKGTAVYGLIAILTSSLLFLAAPSIRRAAEASRKASQQGRAVNTSADQPKQNDWPAFRRLFLVIIFRSTAATAISSFLPLFASSPSVPAPQLAVLRCPLPPLPAFWLHWPAAGWLTGKVMSIPYAMAAACWCPAWLSSPSPTISGPSLPC